MNGSKTMVHLHDGILCSRKKELLPFAIPWMELKSIMLSEISQAIKRQIPDDLTYKWNLIHKAKSKQNITRDIKMKNKLTITREEVRGDNGRKRRKGFQEHVQRTYGQNQRGVGSRVGSKDGWSGESGGGKMETTVLDQQLN